MERDDVTDEPTDLALLTERAAHGDQAAWDEIVTAHTPMLWSLARSLRLSEADAADVVQLTWVRLLEHLPHIGEPRRLAGWLATTVRREALRVQRMRDTVVPSGDPSVFEDLPDTGEPASDAVIRAERDTDVWRAFNQLSPRCQKVLQLLMADADASYASLGSAIGIPVGSIGPTRSRCLSQLRRLLTDRSIDDAELQTRLRAGVAATSAVPDRVLDDAQGALTDRADPSRP
jgi:RNA polymerase sigma factor (sigma-70 family)